MCAKFNYDVNAEQACAVRKYAVKLMFIMPENARFQVNIQHNDREKALEMRGKLIICHNIGLKWNFERFLER